ncbi:MAG: MFS transporter [Burkholderiales bacterium]|nr:MFS transporter [Opitutaceae bacterium]
MNHPAATDSPPPVRPGDRVSFWLKSAYGAAGMSNYFGGQLIKVLSASIFVAGMGVSPAHIGWIFLIFSLWDGFIDPFLGWVSDNTRSRWGRRRPFVFAGGLLAGAIFPLFWIAQPEWSETMKFFYLVGIGMVFYTAFSIWSVPFQSMLTEMTPDSTERTSISAFVSFFSKVAGMTGVWIWALTQLPIFNDPVTGETDSLRGMRFIGVVLGLVIMMLSILPAFLIKERNPDFIRAQAKVPFWPTFKRTFSNVPFRILAVFALVFAFGINLVQGQMFYLRTYYALAGDTVFSAKLTGIEGTIAMVLGIACIPFFQWLCNRLGKKETLMLSTFIILLATWLSWFTYTPQYPWLALVTGLLLMPGYTGMWMVIPSMIADVVDDEELRVGDRREGGFNSIFGWLNKASTSLAYGLAGVIVVWCGFEIAQKANQTPEAFRNMRLCFALLPTLFLVPALFLLARYPLGYARMNEIRAALEARRGRM